MEGCNWKYSAGGTLMGGRLFGPLPDTAEASSVMNDPSARVPTGRPTLPVEGVSRVHELAMLLAVPVEAFTASGKPHVLHASENGDCWLLQCDPAGAPIVRHIGNPASGQHATDTSVADFLVLGTGSPQRQALATLIDGLMETYLAR